MTYIRSILTIGFIILFITVCNVTADRLPNQTPEVLYASSELLSNSGVSEDEGNNLPETGKAQLHDIRKEKLTSEPEHSVDANITSLKMGIDETAQVFLRENPATGYLWNATNSTGIEIVKDTYSTDTAGGGMEGSGGVHSWILKAVEEGKQEFTAVLTRGTGSPSDGDKTYTLNVTVR